MSNYDSTVKLNNGQSIYFKTKKPSIINQLAKALTEQGIQAEVIRKVKICEGRDV